MHVGLLIELKKENKGDGELTLSQKTKNNNSLKTDCNRYTLQ